MSRLVIRPFIILLTVICFLGFTDTFAQDQSNIAYSACKTPCDEYDFGAKFLCCNGGCDAAKDLVNEYGADVNNAADWIDACKDKRSSSNNCTQDQFKEHWNDACSRFVDKYFNQ